jgi:hypothetical protein
VFFEEIFRKLQEQEVDYLVVGGVALMLHGVVRMTADLDLMVMLTESNLEKFVAVMNDMGFRPRVPVPAESFISASNRKSWIEEKNMQVFSFFQPSQAISLIDVFVKEPIPYDELKKDAEAKQLGPITIPVVSIAGLIQLKQLAGRPQDLEDIKSLREIMKS